MTGSKFPEASEEEDGEYCVPAQAVHHLRDQLNAARLEFLNGDYGGRAGVIAGLQAMFAFLNIFEPINDSFGLSPLLALINALKALDQNNVQPLLFPESRSSRSPGSDYRVLVKAMAINAVDMLVDLGNSLLESCAQVAKTLDDCGVTVGEKRITKQTVKKWRESASTGFKKTKLSEALANIKKSEANEIIRAHKNRKAMRALVLISLASMIELYRLEDSQ